MSATAGSLIQLRLIPLEPTGSRSTVCDGTGGEHYFIEWLTDQSRSAFCTINTAH